MDRRGELGQFLRTRRARLTPADVGLAPGLRRRTPGLRREEVAQLAGVGVTWYTWLEQGRRINASSQVLDAIARTLRLDQAEQEHLYRLADLPAVAEVPNDTLPHEVRVVLDALVPVPAVVYNGRYDVLAWNATYAALFPGLVQAPPGRRNVLWQMLTIPACCSAIGNRDAEVQMMVAQFRSSFARHMNEPAWACFVSRLSTASPEFAALWARHEVASPATRIKVFIQNISGRQVQATAASFAISNVPEARMVVYAAVDEVDRIAFEEFTRDPPRVAQCPYHAALGSAAKANAAQTSAAGS